MFALGGRQMSGEHQPSACISEVTIREFHPGDEACFKALNEEWIARHFRIEPKEAVLLADPKGTILDSGGKIFFAVVEDRCVGCCALRRIREEEFEVAKMAVTPAFQGAGIGRKLLHAVVEAGRAMGARRLFLETNHRLTPAIRLYESLGFRHLAPEEFVHSDYERSDVQMELLLP
jgi:putative acetyltransferase